MNPLILLLLVVATAMLSSTFLGSITIEKAIPVLAWFISGVYAGWSLKNDYTRS